MFGGRVCVPSASRFPRALSLPDPGSLSVFLLRLQSLAQVSYPQGVFLKTPSATYLSKILHPVLMCVHFPTLSSTSQIPTGCPTIQLSPDMISPEIASDPTS